MSPGDCPSITVQVSFNIDLKYEDGKVTNSFEKSLMLDGSGSNNGYQPSVSIRER